MTERLARKIWSTKAEDQMSAHVFCLKALEALTIITEIRPNFLPDILQPNHQSFGKCYFMPTVRTGYKKDDNIKSDALYITYDTDIIPFHQLGRFVEYLQSRYDKNIRLKECSNYNEAKFEWVEKPLIQSDEKKNEPLATISVIFNCQTKLLSGVVQVVVKMEVDDADNSLKQHIYSVMKTACVEIFHKIGSESPRHQYRLAVPCPLQSTKPSTGQKPHLLKFQISQYNGIGMYCTECEQYTTEAEAERLLWVKAAYKGPAAYSVYHAGTYIYYLYMYMHI